MMVSREKTLQKSTRPRSGASSSSPTSDQTSGSGQWNTTHSNPDKETRRASGPGKTRGIGRFRVAGFQIGAPAVLILVGMVVSENSYLVHLATAALIAYILTASFNVIYGYAGAFNMAHVMTYGIGAFTSVFLEIRFGLNFWVAGLIAVLIATVLSVLMAFPTKRLSEIFLAIQTLAFAMALSEILVNWEEFSGGTIGIYSIPSPALLGLDLVGGFVEYYWLVAIFAWLVFVLMFAMHRSAMRRKLTAVRESPRILSSVGISIGSTRLVAFAISGMLAGLAGVLFAHFQLVIDLDTFSFTRLIALLLAIIIGGAGYFWGPLFGVVAIMAMDELALSTSSAQDLVYGIGILVLVILTRGGIAGALATVWAKVRNRNGLAGSDAERDTAAVEAELTGPENIPPTDTAPAGAGVAARTERRNLVISDVTVKFGGNVAVDSASIRVATGEVVGLIGPNGAGKTTLLNTVTGDVPTTAGSVTLDGAELLGLDQPRVVRLGVGRTFQSPKVIPELTLLENVMLGGDAKARASLAGQVIYSRRAKADDRAARDRAMGLLADFNLASRANHLAGAQPYGVLRLGEIARNLMANPSFLLLDEPGAGLTDFEREEVATTIRILTDRGIGVLLVDHNLPLITTACHRIYVLQTGRVIAEGPPVEVFAREDVISAYLGAAQ